MTPSSKSEKEHLASIEPVKLGTLWGLKPTVYIPCIWLVFFLAIIAIILGLPATVLSPGTKVRIHSIPSGAAVVVNNVYKGSTPYTDVFPKGRYTIAVSLPAFTTHTEKITTKNIHILRSASFRTKEINAVLALEKPKDFVKKTTEKIASWSMAGRTKLQYFVPDLLSTNLNALESLRIHYQNADMHSPLAHIQETQFSLVRNALPYKNITSNKNDNTSFAFSFMQKTLANDIAVKTYVPFMQNSEQKLSPILILGYPIYEDLSTSDQWFSFRDMKFLYVPRMTLRYGVKQTKTASGESRLFLETEEALKHASDTASTTEILSVVVPSFYIMSREVTQAHYQYFLKETAWNGETNIAPDHKSAYLKEFSPKTLPNMPMRFISYYDALAFVRWVDQQISSLGYKAILPNEYQWRAAALTHKQDTYILDLPNDHKILKEVYKVHGNKPNLYGGVWEFTSSWYAPLPQFANFSGPQYGSEKVILGGGYITKNETAQTRGIQQNMVRTRNASMPPTWVSPYLGFRIALVPRQ